MGTRNMSQQEDSMDKKDKLRGIFRSRTAITALLLVLAVSLTASSVWYLTSGASSPSVGWALAGGNMGPCTYFISLDGATPVAHAMVFVGGLQPGDNIVGTPGHFASLWNSIVQASESICVSDGTFTVDSADLGSNLGLNVYSNDRIILSSGTIINQVAGQYLGNLNNVDQMQGFFVNKDRVNGNSNIEIGGGTIVGTQPNAPNTSYSTCMYFLGASHVSVHDMVWDGCGSILRSLTADNTKEPAKASSVGIWINRIVIQHSAPFGVSISTSANVHIDSITALANSSIDDIIAIQNSAQEVFITNCYLDKLLNDGVHPSGGRPIEMQANPGTFGFVDIHISGNTLRKSVNDGTLGAVGAISISTYGLVRNIDFSNNLIYGTSFGIQIIANAGSTVYGINIASNTIYNELYGGINIEAVATIYGLTISNNMIYDNGNALSFQNGIRLIGDVSPGYVNTIITGNQIFDNRTTPTQVFGIIFAENPTSTWINTIIANNYFNQTALLFPPTNSIRPNEFKRLQIGNNVNYNPFGKFNANMFNNQLNYMGLFGNTTTILANTIYVVTGFDIILSSTGGTGVSISEYDASGVGIAVGLSALTFDYLPVGFRINFGGFSVAPTVTVVGN